MQGLANLVAVKLQSIPRSTLVRFWHRSTLELFKYLSFEKL